MIRKYRKKPTIIEAVQFNGENGEEIETFTNNTAQTLATHAPLIKIGEMLVRTGDWIIKGTNGEFYPIKDTIFRLTYDLTEQEEDEDAEEWEIEKQRRIVEGP